MKKIFATVFAIVLSLSTVAFAAPYTMENGDWVFVDSHAEVGASYAIRSSVRAEKYAPPNYQLSIEVVEVVFSEDYFLKYHTFDGCPYRVASRQRLHFRYDWDRKVMSYQSNEVWKDWDVDRIYTHVEGAPLLPNTAEVAFVSAYNMKFFGNRTNYNGYRVIGDELYRALGF